MTRHDDTELASGVSPRHLGLCMVRLHQPARSGPLRRCWRSTTLAFVVSVAGAYGMVFAVAPPASAAAVWSIMGSPNQNRFPADFLSDVACASTRNCFAVGDNGKTTSAVRPADTLTEHWDGSSWSVRPSPNPNAYPAEFELDGVSCPSPRSCFAVGWNANAIGYDGPPATTLIEHWNGTSWSITPSPNATAEPGSFLSKVSCPSSNSCFAVGYNTNTTYRGATATAATTLIEHWNGTSWSIIPSPNPTTEPASFLYGVSCPSTTSCFAVGDDQAANFSAAQTLIEHWDGSVWTILSSPNPTRQPDSQLVAVSCANTNSCAAVGNNQNDADRRSCTDVNRTLERHELVDHPQPQPDRAPRLLPQRRGMPDPDHLHRRR